MDARTRKYQILKEMSTQFEPVKITIKRETVEGKCSIRVRVYPHNPEIGYSGEDDFEYSLGISETEDALELIAQRDSNFDEHGRFLRGSDESMDDFPGHFANRRESTDLADAYFAHIGTQRDLRHS